MLIHMAMYVCECVCGRVWQRERLKDPHTCANTHNLKCFNSLSVSVFISVNSPGWFFVSNWTTGTVSFLPNVKTGTHFKM